MTAFNFSTQAAHGQTARGRTYRAASGTIVVLPHPLPGENLCVDMISGSAVGLAFNPSDATVSRSGDSLTFTMDQGGSATIKNFFVMEDGGDLPSPILPGGEEVSAALAFAGNSCDGTCNDPDIRVIPAIPATPGGLFTFAWAAYEDALPYRHPAGRQIVEPGRLFFNFTPGGTTFVTDTHLAGFHEGTVIYSGVPSDPDAPNITITGPDQIVDFNPEDFQNGVYLVPPVNSAADMDITAVMDVMEISSGIRDSLTGNFTVFGAPVTDMPGFGCDIFVIPDPVCTEYEKNPLHGSHAKDEENPHAPGNSNNEDRGMPLSITWSFPDSYEYVTEIIITVPMDRHGNPVGEIVYKGAEVHGNHNKPGG